MPLRRSICLALLRPRPFAGKLILTDCFIDAAREGHFGTTRHSAAVAADFEAQVIAPHRADFQRLFGGVGVGCPSCRRPCSVPGQPWCAGSPDSEDDSEEDEDDDFDDLFGGSRRGRRGGGGFFGGGGGRRKKRDWLDDSEDDDSDD